MAGFRVRVSFENDEKLQDEKYWMLVNKEGMKLVSDLMKSIEEKFSVNCDKLMLDDARLPDRESIDILQKNDLIKVHVRRNKVPIPEVTESEEEKKARKLERKKRKVLEKEADIPPVQTVEVAQIQPAVEVAQIQPAADDDNSGPKRKRRRRKHKSAHTSSPVEVQQPSPMLPPAITFIPPAKGSRKHIHFGDEDSDKNVPEKVFTNGHSKLNNASPVAAPLNALLSLRSAVFSRNNNKEGSSIKSPAVSLIPLSAPSTEKVKQDFTKFPVFSGPPRVGDVVAFKVLELSENYCPEISDYFQGRITEVLPSGDVTIDLIGEGKVKKHSRGKFELIDPKEEEYEEDFEVDEGMLEEEIESTVSYNWSQLIEPRLIT